MRPPYVDSLDSQNVKLATASRSQVLVTVDVGDRSAALGQTAGSHAVLTLVHLDAQSEPDPVSDVEPVQMWRRNWDRPWSYLLWFDMTHSAAFRTHFSLSVIFFGVPVPASRPTQ